MRWICLSLGILFFVLGIIGTILPVMPTAPFILLSAACWARGSKRFYLWLINHNRFGQYVRDWEDHRAVPRKAKWFSTITMFISGTSLFFTLPNHLLWLASCVAVAFIGSIIVLWYLPDA